MYQKANIMIIEVLPGVPYVHATPALGAQKKVADLVASPHRWRLVRQHLGRRPVGS